MARGLMMWFMVSQQWLMVLKDGEWLVGDGLLTFNWWLITVNDDGELMVNDGNSMVHWWLMMADDWLIMMVKDEFNASAVSHRSVAGSSLKCEQFMAEWKAMAIAKFSVATTDLLGAHRKSLETIGFKSLQRAS